MNTHPLQLIPKKTHAPQDRLFTLTWNNGKLIRLAVHERFKQHTARGVHFASGYVCLELGTVYETMSELVERLEQSGTYTLVYDDEEAAG